MDPCMTTIQTIMSRTPMSSEISELQDITEEATGLLLKSLHTRVFTRKWMLSSAVHCTSSVALSWAGVEKGS